MAKKITPKIVGFICNRSAFALQKNEQFRMPDNVDIKRIICLGRVNLSFILKAFELGADGFLMIGCPKGECQYSFGNRQAEEQLVTAVKMGHLLGIEKERFAILHTSLKKEVRI
nr:hydrogenase iron-sulfur subunit [Candidatus Cloacimonadota bacterium]